MSTTGDGWRNSDAYDYFDDLTPEQTAYEFLRRDPDYATAYRAAGDGPEAEDELSAQAMRRGLRFAIDPSLRADETPVLWLPRHNPRLLLLTTLPASLVDGPTLRDAGPAGVLDAPEGAYLDLLALAPERQALLASDWGDANPLALVLPLDGLFESRLEAGRRLLHRLVGGRTPKPSGFTAHRRRRLKLVLRALDGFLAEEGYRGVARVLFPGRIPTGSRWRTDSARSRTIRLVKDGLALMRGGYLDLLRPERRRPRSRS